MHGDVQGKAGSNNGHNQRAKKGQPPPDFGRSTAGLKFKHDYPGAECVVEECLTGPECWVPAVCGGNAAASLTRGFFARLRDAWLWPCDVGGEAWTWSRHGLNARFDRLRLKTLWLPKYRNLFDL